VSDPLVPVSPQEAGVNRHRLGAPVAGSHPLARFGMGRIALCSAESSWAPCSCCAISLERRDLLLGCGELGRRAADLRYEFVKSGAVHCSPHTRRQSGDPGN
jgi:hypothetical protein